MQGPLHALSGSSFDPKKELSPQPVQRVGVQANMAERRLRSPLAFVA